jgi:Zn-dependent protease with chaperone function
MLFDFIPVDAPPFDATPIHQQVVDLDRGSQHFESSIIAPTIHAPSKSRYVLPPPLIRQPLDFNQNTTLKSDSIELRISQISYRIRTNDPIRLVESRISDVAGAYCNFNYPCGGRVYVVKSKSINAWAKGGNVFVSERLVQDSNLDELAFVIAHEIGHNLLRHDNCGKVCELEADSFAGSIMSAAAFYQNAPSQFLKRHRTLSTFQFSHPSIKRRIAAVESGMRLPLTHEVTQEAVRAILGDKSGASSLLDD